MTIIDHHLQTLNNQINSKTTTSKRHMHAVTRFPYFSDVETTSGTFEEYFMASTRIWNEDFSPVSEILSADVILTDLPTTQLICLTRYKCLGDARLFRNFITRINLLTFWSGFFPKSSRILTAKRASTFPMIWFSQRVQ